MQLNDYETTKTTTLPISKRYTRRTTVTSKEYARDTGETEYDEQYGVFTLAIVCLYIEERDCSVHENTSVQYIIEMCEKSKLCFVQLSCARSSFVSLIFA